MPVRVVTLLNRPNGSRVGAGGEVRGRQGSPDVSATVNDAPVVFDDQMSMAPLVSFTRAATPDSPFSAVTRPSMVVVAGSIAMSWPFTVSVPALTLAVFRPSRRATR